MLGSAEGRTDYRTEVDVVVFVHALISFGLCILCPLSRLYLCRFITILTMIHVYKRRYSSVVEPRDTRSLAYVCFALHRALMTWPWGSYPLATR